MRVLNQIAEYLYLKKKDPDRPHSQFVTTRPKFHPFDRNRQVARSRRIGGLRRPAGQAMIEW